MRRVKRRFRWPRFFRTSRAIRKLDARLRKLERLIEHPQIMAVTAPSPAFPSPAVSVVMPSWNRAALVGAAIRSAQAQTFPDWELIVVDDGSTDDTEAVVASFAADRRIRYFRREHAGQSAARNFALRNARGTLVAYLDSDDLWYPEFLAAAVSVFSALPEVDCAYGAMMRGADTKGQPIILEPFDRTKLLEANFIGMTTFVHRRGLIDSYGTFDERLATLEDWDLILRYTSHAPAYRLPVLAARRRLMDEKRVTDTTRPHQDEAATLIRSKWSGK